MSAWATTWAYEQDVSPCGKKAVLVALAHFADAEGYCFPSQETLALMTSQGISTVREHLKSLESENVLNRKPRYSKKHGGGRTSDGFYLQAPPERLQPLPPKSSTNQNVTARIQQTYRQNSADLPPKSGGDLLVDQSKKDHAGLMRFLSERESPIPDGAAQGSAVKWLLKSYGADECKQCFSFLEGQEWRESRVSWLTVKQQIAAWKSGALRRLPTHSEMNQGGRGRLVI